MNKRTKKVAIIGGGASGLFSAIELFVDNDTFKGDDVVIIEKNDRVGKKILVTGNGQCNLSNTDLSANHYYGDKGFITAFLNNDISIVDYLAKIGIYTIIRDEGKIYPVSMTASSVLDNIRSFLISKNVEILTQCEVKKIEKNNNEFLLNTSQGDILANCVIASFGGKSGKQFGTDGSSYKLIENLGHKTTKLYPSLVQLKTETEYIKGLKGIKERIKLSAITNGVIVKSVVGDILFTDYGISGDAVFKISSILTDKENAEVLIEFLPEMNSDQLSRIIDSRKQLDYIDKLDLLNGIVNKRVGQLILKRSKSYNTSDIVNTIKDFRLKVIGNTGFDQSQVTKGGIDTNSVNPFTMKSKLVEGLFIVGEALNVDGECGGYNLTFAFLSGITASKEIKRKLAGD